EPDGHGPHPDAPRRHGGRDGRRGLLPGERRRGVHHGADDLRRRRAHALRRLPPAVVLGVGSAIDNAPSAAGVLRHVSDANALEALALVRRGRIYDLGRVLDERAPVFPGRYFRQTLVSTAHHANASMPVGDNQVNWITEVFTATTQLGTHLDTLGHLQMG